MLPRAGKKPGHEESGKHPLNSAPQAKKIFDHADQAQLKAKRKSKEAPEGSRDRKKRGSNPYVGMPNAPEPSGFFPDL